MGNLKKEWNFNYYGLSSRPMKKPELIEHYMLTMFARTTQMFEYKNLPDTIKKRDLEVLMQSRGYGVGVMVNGKPYVLLGGLGGVLNEQYLPTQAIVTNPYLKLSKTYDIDKDCVIFKNDSMYQGLVPLARKYATLLAETDISLKYGAINSRILSMVYASDDKTKESAEKVLKDVEDGEKLGVIGGLPMLDSFKTYPYSGSTNSYIKSLLELHQYLKANWFIDLGINSNYNMKRESLSQNEVDVNEGTLLPLMDDMLECRKIAWNKFNELFGTNVSVDFSSSWKKLVEEIKLELKAKENEEKKVEETENLNEEESKEEENGTNES